MGMLHHMTICLSNENLNKICKILVLPPKPYSNQEPGSYGYAAPYDHMFEQSELEQNIQNFGFTPKSFLKLYTGSQVEWESNSNILQVHQWIKASKMPTISVVAYQLNLV